MQRTYRIWDAEAHRAALPITTEVSNVLVAKLIAGGSVVVGESVLMKVQMDETFKSEDNPKGEFVYAVYGGGEVVAAAESATTPALRDAVEWAAAIVATCE